MAGTGGTRGRLVTKMMIKMLMLMTTTAHLTAGTSFPSPTPRNSGTYDFKTHFQRNQLRRILRSTVV